MQRKKTAAILKDNPSFKHHLDEMLSEAYEMAAVAFEIDSNLEEEILPAACPYSFDEIMDEKFFPAKE